MHRRTKLKFTPKISQPPDRKPVPSPDNRQLAESRSQPIKTTTVEKVVDSDDDRTRTLSVSSQDAVDVATPPAAPQSPAKKPNATASPVRFAVPERLPVVVNPKTITPNPLIEKHLKAKEITQKEKARDTPLKEKPRDKTSHVKGAKKPKICLGSKTSNVVTDKSNFTMRDLLTYNPPPSDAEQERRRRKEAEEEDNEPHEDIVKTEDSDAKENDGKKDKPKDKEADQGPRVKVGPDGELIIDEASLVVRPASFDDTEPIYEGKEQTSSLVTYASFRNRPTKKTRWSCQETVKFYTALAAIGTDFSMMSQLYFKNERSRIDLRNKFKREEKVNRQLIDRVLNNQDISFINEVESDPESDVAPEPEETKPIIKNIINNVKKQPAQSKTKKAVARNDNDGGSSEKPTAAKRSRKSSTKSTDRPQAQKNSSNEEVEIVHAEQPEQASPETGATSKTGKAVKAKSAKASKPVAVPLRTSSRTRKQVLRS